MYHVQRGNMTRARDLADLISSGKIELGEIATDTQASLGNTDLYGFKKTNGTGSQLEDLIFAFKKSPSVTGTYLKCPNLFCQNN